MYGGLGGGEVALLQHARSLRDIGTHVHVVLLENGPFAKQLEADGFSVEIIPFLFGRNRITALVQLLQATLLVSSLLKMERPDLVVSYTFNDFVLFSIPCRVSGIPIALRAQGEYFKQGSEKPNVWLGNLFVPLIKATRAHVIPTTRHETACFLQAGAPSESCSHIPLGALPQKTLVDHQKIERTPVISIFGRLTRWKGQDVFLNAMALLKSQGHHFKARIVGGADFGDGEEFRHELDEIVKAHGLAGDVEFLGHRSDVQSLMADSEIVCHCSKFEPFGLVVIEAMRAGCAVVASDVAGPRESIVDGETGFLVPPGNPVKIAERVATLLTDPVLRQKLSQRAIQYAAAHFDLESNLRRLNDQCLSLK